MTDSKCPIHNPLNRVRALIAFEVLRAVLVLAIMGWWGYMLVEQAADGKARHMLFWEAISLFVLVTVSTGFSLWFYLRDHTRARTLQSFFASMAHELRTPLASIRLQAESLAARARTKSPYIARLISDTSRLEAQVERGLELARAESGRALPATRIALEDAWRRALALFPKEDTVRLKITAAPLAPVMADTHALQVILRNLIENTLHHSGRKSPAIFVHTVANAGDVTFVFRDNGKGSSLPRLGQIFQKGTDSRGTGIGLYLIRALMKQQGGSARFHADSGFTATLVFRAAADV